MMSGHFRGDGVRDFPTDTSRDQREQNTRTFFIESSQGDRAGSLSDLLESLVAWMSSEFESTASQAHGRIPRALAVGVSCSSRDSLDKEVHLVHSDMGVRGVRAAVEHFQGWEVRWAVPEEAEAGAVDVHTMTREDIKEHRERVRDAWLQRPLLHVLAATDACLGALGGALGVDVLVHVEPPAKRDALRRRQAAMFGGDAGAQEVREMLQSEGTKAGRVELLILSAGDGDPQGYVGKGRSVNPLIDVGEMLL